MTPNQNARQPKILFGVTSAQSLKLLGKIPSKMAMSGWDVHIVSASGPELLGIDLTGITHHVVEMPRTPFLTKDFNALFSWLGLLAKVRPDAVSIGTPKAALLGLVAARLRQVPVRVYMLRGLRLEGQRGGWGLLLWFLEWTTSSSSTHIISVSHSLQAKYLSKRLAPREKITVLGMGSSHGVDLTRFTPRAHSLKPYPYKSLLRARSQGRPVIAFAGRFSREKGAPTLAACKKALDQLPIDYEFLIVGQIEDSAELFDGMNSTGRPVLHISDAEDLSPIYPILELLLLPSEREGLPNVVLEAAASETTAVVTTATGAVDSVVSGETGVAVPLGDEDKFIQAVVQLLTDRARREDLGRRARRWVSKHYDEEKVSRRYIDFYNSILFRQTCRHVATVGQKRPRL